MGVLNTLKYSNSPILVKNEYNNDNNNLLITKTNNPDMYRQAMKMQAAEVLDLISLSLIRFSFMF